MATFETIGSTGTLVGAAFQTAGQYFQSDFLDIIQQNAGISIGALCYLISSIVALFLIAMGGTYRHTIYFLVAPGLFWFVVTNRVETEGSEWIFGDRHYDFSIIDSLFDSKILDWKKGDPPRVSWVYARWDELTSGIVGYVVEKLPVEALEGDIKFLRQSQRYSTVFNLTIDNNELSYLITKLLFAPQCAEYLNLKLAKYQKPKIYSDEDLKERLAPFDDMVVFTPHDPTLYGVLDYIKKRASSSFIRILGVGAAVSALIGTITGGGSISGVDDTFDDIIDLFLGEITLTCPQMWGLAADLTANYAALRVDVLLRSRLAIDEDEDDENLSFKILARKFDYDNCDIDDYSCFAKCSVLDSNCTDASRNMYRTMAIRMLHSHLTSINAYQLQRPLPYQSISAEGLDSNYGGIAQDLRYQAVDDEYQAKGEFLALLWGLPHLQAIILFFLALSFPFFAFTLLIPGRHWAIGTWMSLWFWAKSWDIGFALVMIADQILYYFLPKGPEMTDDIFYDPAEAFYTVFRDDPNVSMAMYYTIVASLLLAVPVITGFIVKRGAREATKIAERAIESFSSQVGSAWGSSYRDAINNYKNKMFSSSSNQLGSSALTQGMAVSSTSDPFSNVAPSHATPQSQSPSIPAGLGSLRAPAVTPSQSRPPAPSGEQSSRPTSSPQSQYPAAPGTPGQTPTAGLPAQSPGTLHSGQPQSRSSRPETTPPTTNKVGYNDRGD